MTYRVFISSTFVDLAEYRKSVQEAIRQLGAMDVSMEHFGARDERPAGECERLVRDESDVFVGIYAHRYGFVPEGSEVSVSELEYRAASDKPLPRFIYILDEKQPWVPAHIDAGMKADKLKAFKEALLKRHMCQIFTGKDQLATRVVADVGRHMAWQRVEKVGPDIPVNDIGLDSMYVPASNSGGEWEKRRQDIYDGNRGIFLTHVAYPSAKPGQEFDVYIYLIRHKPEMWLGKQFGDDQFADVQFAEFFLGPYWRNKVFPAVAQNGFVGISTSAYGGFLCTCQVTLKDGTKIFIERYIDFEMLRAGDVN